MKRNTDQPQRDVHQASGCLAVRLSVRLPLVEGDGPAVLRKQLAARSLGGTRWRSHGGIHLGGLQGLLHLRRRNVPLYRDLFHIALLATFRCVDVSFSFIFNSELEYVESSF